MPQTPPDLIPLPGSFDEIGDFLPLSDSTRQRWQELPEKLEEYLRLIDDLAALTARIDELNTFKEEHIGTPPTSATLPGYLLWQARAHVVDKECFQLAQEREALEDQRRQVESELYDILPGGVWIIVGSHAVGANKEDGTWKLYVKRDYTPDELTADLLG